LADLGYALLILAFIAAIFSVVAVFAGKYRNSQGLIAGVRTGVLIVAGLYTIAIAIMMYAFIDKDYSLRIVADYSSNDLSTVYAFCALYADKAGSLMYWGWLVSLLTAVIAIWKFNSYRQIMPYTLAILAIVQALFLMFVTILANVFEKSPESISDGYGLNPLLQNFGMLLHPPLLYLGFASFMVVFAFVMGALIARSPRDVWISGIRRWTLFAWCALGLGNIIGAWWAYNELGWGGYWAWDPVENAGIMPWLLGTAFIHSISMLRKRNYLQTWSFALIILTFVFVLLSPFITHGGIESPLHGFNNSPFPPYVLGAIITTLLVFFGLLYLRARNFKPAEKPGSFVSREGAFLLTNIILTVITALIIAGTVFPSLREALGGSKVALDRNFFDWSCGPILLALVFFIGICPMLGWRKASWPSIRKHLLYAFVAAIIGAVIVLVSGIGNWYAVAALVCGFPLLTITSELFRGTRALHRSRGGNYVRSFLSLTMNNRPRYGGFIVHIGIILITVGVIGSSIYDVEKVETIARGESMSIGSYELTYSDLVIEQKESKLSATAAIVVSRDGNRVDTLYPEYNYWFKWQDYYPEVAVRITPAEDLFIVLAAYDTEKDLVAIRSLINPLIVWIWVGGALLLLGGIVSFWPDRRRMPVSAPAGESAGKLTDDDIEKQISELRQFKEKEAEKTIVTICPKCNTEYKPGDQFCSVCGARLSSK